MEVAVPALEQGHVGAYRGIAGHEDATADVADVVPPPLYPVAVARLQRAEALVGGGSPRGRCPQAVAELLCYGEHLAGVVLHDAPLLGQEVLVGAEQHIEGDVEGTARMLGQPESAVLVLIVLNHAPARALSRLHRDELAGSVGGVALALLHADVVLAIVLIDVAIAAGRGEGGVLAYLVTGLVVNLPQVGHAGYAHLGIAHVVTPALAVEGQRAQRLLLARAVAVEGGHVDDVAVGGLADEALVAAHQHEEGGLGLGGTAHAHGAAEGLRLVGHLAIGRLVGQALEVDVAHRTDLLAGEHGEQRGQRLALLHLEQHRLRHRRRFLRFILHVIVVLAGHEQRTEKGQ